MSEALKVAEIFGEDVFNDTVMQERLPKKVYKDLKKIIEEGKELDLATADVIAHEMKEWAWAFGNRSNESWNSVAGDAAEFLLLISMGFYDCIFREVVIHY